MRTTLNPNQPIDYLKVLLVAMISGLILYALWLHAPYHLDRYIVGFFKTLGL